MELEIFEWLAGSSGLKVHIAVFTLLLLGGVGFPIPEDIPLILAGVAGQREIVSLHSIFLTSYFGVLIADQVVYFIGYFFGPKILNAGTNSTFFPAITEDRICKIRDGLRRRRLFYIFLGRHMFPVRTATFIVAGALRIPYLEFLISDAFAALVSVSLVVGLGYFLGGRITPEVLQVMIHDFHYVLLGIVALCLTLWLLKRYVLKKKKPPADSECSKSLHETNPLKAERVSK